MSSDFYAFDASFYPHSTSDLASTEADQLQFFCDSFSSFSDSPNIDILHLISSDDPDKQNPVEQSHYLDQTVSDNLTHRLSSSPPSHQMENLSLSQTTHLQPLANCSNGFVNISNLEVNSQVALGSSYDPIFLAENYSFAEYVAQILQKSYSSKSFDEKPCFFHQPGIDNLMQSPNFHANPISSPENSSLSAHIRRVFSTGDLQNLGEPQMTQRSFSNPLSLGRSFNDEANFKVGRYSADERRERIHKYRVKRAQRNFNKTIKYACRKTLADNRPRIRGRFARNDELGDTPKTAILIKDEEDDDLWVAEEDYEGTVRGGGHFLNNFGQNQFQYYGY